MDCETFFQAVDETVGESAADPSRTTTAQQCVFECFHPRVVERLGTDGLATRFNRSGIVWAPTGRRLGVQIRVPAAQDAAVQDALEDAPLSFERTDHRGVSAPDGEMVSILHFSARTDGVSEPTVRETLRAVAAAFRV